MYGTFPGRVRKQTEMDIDFSTVGGCLTLSREHSQYLRDLNSIYSEHDSGEGLDICFNEKGTSSPIGEKLTATAQ